MKNQMCVPIIVLYKQVVRMKVASINIFYH